MHLTAIHRTIYEYPSPAIESHNELRLMPLSDSSQRCLDFVLEVQPPTNVYSYSVPGGIVHHFTIRGPHRRLEIKATAQVETFLSNPFEGLSLGDANWKFYEDDAVRQAFVEFLSPSPYVDQVGETRQIARREWSAGKGVVDYVLDLNARINSILEYDADVTHVHTTVSDVLRQRAGVCQDFAHLMIACCRSIGIPARYVSGYLYEGEGMRGELATHAWVECLMPDFRWIAFDPTNNILANDHHIRVHVGRDYSEVSPAHGIFLGAPATKLDVSVRVERAAATVA